MVSYLNVKFLNFGIVQFVPSWCIGLEMKVRKLWLVVYYTRENVRGYSSIVLTQHRVRTQSIATNVKLGEVVLVD